MYTESTAKPKDILSAISSIRLTRKTNFKKEKNKLLDLGEVFIVLVSLLYFTIVPFEGS